MTKKVFTPGKGYTQEEWDDVTDSPEITPEMIARSQSFAEAFPDIAASARRGRGPQKSPTKQQVTLRLDPDVIEHFKAAGPGWQRRINDALRAAAGKRSASVKMG